MTPKRDHDWGFFYWSAVGFLMSFGVIAILSIGFPFFVLGFVLLVVGAWRGPRWPADLGFLSGIGAACLLIALIQAFVGSLSPTIWATVGTGLVALGAAPFWWLRCRRPGATSA